MNEVKRMAHEQAMSSVESPEYDEELILGDMLWDSLGLGPDGLSSTTGPYRKPWVATVMREAIEQL